MIPVYRIFRIGDGGMPETLFHGYLNWELGKRSRRVVMNSWEHAERKRVTNPGKKGTGANFVSGWHVIEFYTDAELYLRRFKDTSQLVICRVWVEGLRDKPRAMGNVKLADTMLVTSADWMTALMAHSFNVPLPMLEDE